MPAVAELGDESLIVRARTGGADGHAAFRALYDRHARVAWSFLRGLLRDPARTDDALQETFFRVYQALDRVDADRPFRTFLLQVAKNVAIDVLRSEKKHARLVPRVATGAEDSLEREEDRARARDALAALPDEARALLVARHATGLSLAELAAGFAVSERTVSERLREAAGLMAQAIALRLGRRRS